MSGFHVMRRLTDVSPEGRHVQCLRFGIGYWPCLNAFFVQLGIGKYLYDFWYGEASHAELRDLASRSPKVVATKDAKGGSDGRG